MVFDYRQPDMSGTDAAAGGYVKVQPFPQVERSKPGYRLIPEQLMGRLVEGVAQIPLECTDTYTTGCWLVESPLGVTRFITVPAGTGSITADACPDVNPSSFAPVEDVIAAWTAVATTATEAAAAAEAAQAAAEAVPTTTDGIVTALLDDPGSATSVALSSTYGAPALDAPGTDLRTIAEAYRVPPIIAPITERIEYYRQIVAMNAGTIWALYSRAGETPTFDVSTDQGETWTTLSTMPAVVDKVARLSTGTFLAMAGGAGATVYRSADAGATWATVPAGLGYGPLTAQGICEGADGSVCIAEYGAAPYPNSRVMRSTDDGLTWAAVLTVTGHHCHSLTWDPVQEVHVLFADNTTLGLYPQIYTSADNCATFTLLGEVLNDDMPNFVAPCYFANHIAWASDSQINGRISRISRADFYAGNFDQVEHVAQVSQRAAYATFPLRPDVWAIAFNGEHIASEEQTGGGGTMTCDVWLLSRDGLTLAGGLDSYYRTTRPGSLSGVRPSFPSIPYNVNDHAGFAWFNMPLAIPRPYAGVPVTQGWGTHSTRLDHSSTLTILKRDVGLLVQKTNKPSDGYIRIISPAATQVNISNDVTGATVRGELQFHDNGDLIVRSGTTVVATVRVVNGVGVMFFNGRIDTSPNEIGIRAGSGSPEGVVSAQVGTIYQTWSPPNQLWYKQTGTGNTGWRPILDAIDTAANLALATSTVNTVGKYEGRQAFDTTNDRPVWASGATATAPWKYADGTTAVTPA